MKSIRVLTSSSTVAFRWYPMLAYRYMPMILWVFGMQYARLPKSIESDGGGGGEAKKTPCLISLHVARALNLLFRLVFDVYFFFFFFFACCAYVFLQCFSFLFCVQYQKYINKFRETGVRVELCGWDGGEGGIDCPCSLHDYAII